MKVVLLKKAYNVFYSPKNEEITLPQDQIG